MKKTLITIAVLFSFLSTQAQENSIIYTLYEPDSCFTFQSVYDTLKLDLDQDGAGDAIIFVIEHPTGGFNTYLITAANWKWGLWVDNIYLTDTTTIDENVQWRNNPVFLDYSETNFPHFAFRHQTDDGVHYGWAYIDCNIYVWPVCISGMGYCTLPDTPILWGQTEMVGVDETEATAFAIVHPNPTMGMVTLTGENLKKAEVTNMLGQHVATANGQGGQLTVDLSQQPAGIYFVSVTDESGRKCVHKVVKE